MYSGVVKVLRAGAAADDRTRNNSVANNRRRRRLSRASFEKTMTSENRMSPDTSWEKIQMTSNKCFCSIIK